MVVQSLKLLDVVFFLSDEAYDNFITMLLLIIHILFMKSELLYTSRCVVGCYPVLEIKFSFQAYPLLSTIYDWVWLLIGCRKTL